jgi:hypothetical protein
MVPNCAKFASAAARCRFGAAGRVARSPAASGVRHVVVCARQRHQRPIRFLRTESIFTIPIHEPPANSFVIGTAVINSDK